MKLGFYSTATGLSWGGSEVLWGYAALLLQEKNYHLGVNYEWHPKCPEVLDKIQQKGGIIFWRRKKTHRGLKRSIRKRLDKLLKRYKRTWLDEFKPDFVLITVAFHLDDLSIASECKKRDIPYAINLQAASWNYWMPDRKLEHFRSAYTDAKKCFFLSEENKEIVEANLALQLGSTQIVDNPFNISIQEPLAWPDEDEIFKLACVGRLSFPSKGQDLIIRVMRENKWRQRPIHIAFWGAEEDCHRQLEELIQLYDLEHCMSIAGFSTNLVELWSDHHALLLPSRHEGLPMVTVEAMLAGRPCIVTDCGRNGELVDDNETGFLISAAVASCLDEALERAWSKRNKWEQMGKLASERIRQRYSSTPVEDFAVALEELAI